VLTVCETTATLGCLMRAWPVVAPRLMTFKILRSNDLVWSKLMLVPQKPQTGNRDADEPYRQWLGKFIAPTEIASSARETPARNQLRMVQPVRVPEAYWGH